MQLLTNALRAKYQILFDTCSVRPERVAEVEAMAKFIATNRASYDTVSARTDVPWFFIGTLHCMECDPPRFKKHLHNGDPLGARTVQEPVGRPKVWNPPNDWETSAEDALRSEGFAHVSDWSLPAILYRMERFNGFGYRNLPVPIETPYLWSFSQHYTRGKFVKDKVFSPAAVSQQCGAAVILRRLAERGTVTFDSNNTPMVADALSSLAPLVLFSTKKKSDAARRLQEALNRFDGIFVHIDGIPGRETSNALERVTGHFLKGDPRENV